MKKSKLFVLLASVSLLASCGEATNTSADPASSVVASDIRVRLNGDGTVMVGKTTEITVRISRDTTNSGFDAEIEDESVASITMTDTTITVTGKKIGTTVLTVSSVANPNVKETLDINVVAVSNPTLELKAAKTVVTQNGTLTLNAEVTDYTGDITYSWKSLYQKGNFSGDKTSSSVTYNANSFGSDTIQVSFVLGEETYTDTIDVFVKADHTNWTAISTAADFKTNLLAETTVSGNFYLTADIDLGGEAINFHNGNKFAGKLDGQGFSIKNYEVKGNPADKYANGGLFGGVDAGAILANIGFEGVVIGQEGTGWGTSSIATDFAGSLENCKIDVAHTFDGSSLMDENQWFPFCSALVGVMKEGSSFRNIVVNVDKSNEAGFKTIFADVAYPAGGSLGTSAQNAQQFSVVNFYTDSTVVGGSVWEWGSPVEDQSSYHTGLDWTTAGVNTYADLDAHIWNIAAGAMPDLIEIA